MQPTPPSRGPIEPVSQAPAVWCAPVAPLAPLPLQKLLVLHQSFPDPALRTHLEPHHEALWGTLAPVEQSGKLHADVHIIQVQVLPLGLSIAQQGSKLMHLGPHVAATFLHLDLRVEKHRQ